jgi:hypothetical protein
MKFSLITILLLCASSAHAASAFRTDSPVPAQLQGQILTALTSACDGGDWSETKTTVYESAGETYFETVLGRENSTVSATVYSGIGRLGGFGVINVDCGA